MFHAYFVWAGLISQIVHIFRYQSAQDIMWYMVLGLLLSEFVALPRAVDSQYWVWKLCHKVSAGLVAVLLAGVILYG